MTYEEIKRETKKAVENQKTTTEQKIDKLYDGIDDLLYEATERGKGELTKFITDIKIYDTTEKGISIHSEPRKLRKIITDLLYELGRPIERREHIEYNL